jgi:hypothetical protein
MKKIILALSVATLSLGTMAATMPAQAAMYGNGGYSQQQHYKFQKQGKYAYLNGHQGDIHKHNGWKYYNGYYFPPAAFVITGLVFGTILGTILSQHH